METEYKIRKAGVFFLLVLLVAVLATACGEEEEPASTPHHENATATQNAPPPIPHSLMGRSRCSTCHTAGISDIPREPPSHTGRTDQLCGFCHKPLGEESTGALPIPHTLAGRSECLVCHYTGIASAPPIPPEMAELGNDHCMLCHWPAGVAVATPTPGLATPTPVAGPPGIPHGLEGREDCLLCHAATVPADHADRPSDTCVLCHKPVEAPVATPTPTPSPTPTAAPPAAPTPTPTAAAPGMPPPIPHTLEGREDCLLCHKPVEAPVVTPTPTPSPTPTAAPPAAPTPTPTAAAPGMPPPIPHTLEGRAECLLCHAATVPADHADRPNEMCTLCHKPEGS